jgi:hypothetical protein
VRQLAQHSGKPPDQLSEEDLRQYFLYLRNHKRVSRSTTTTKRPLSIPCATPGQPICLKPASLCASFRCGRTSRRPG